MEAFTLWVEQLNKNPLTGAIVGILALVLRLEIDRRARRSAHKKQQKRKHA